MDRPAEPAFRAADHIRFTVPAGAEPVMFIHLSGELAGSAGGAGAGKPGGADGRTRSYFITIWKIHHFCHVNIPFMYRVQRFMRNISPKVHHSPHPRTSAFISSMSDFFQPNVR